MLGRLFKLSADTIAPLPLGALLLLTLLLATHDDCHTRGLLYGTPNCNPLKPYHLDEGGFRVVVAQDLGTLHRKDVLFDSLRRAPGLAVLLVLLAPLLTSLLMLLLLLVATGDRGASLAPQGPTTLPSLHNASELTSYMFGCFPLLETQVTTKIHMLPPLLLVHGAMVLILRIFSLDDDLSSSGDDDDDWMVLPPAPGPNVQAPKLALRLALGLVIPMEVLTDITDVVFANWGVVNHHLNQLQALVVQKTVAAQPQPEHCRLRLADYCFQSDSDFYVLVKRFIRLMDYVVNTPRVVGLPEEVSARHQVLKQWILEVINWIEFKDGKPEFLARLFATLNQYFPRRATTDEKTRVVVVLNNQLVAKKLIFIINLLMSGLGPLPTLALPAVPMIVDDLAVDDDTLDTLDDVHLTLLALSCVTPLLKGWAIPVAAALTAATLTPIVVPHRLPQLLRLVAYLSSSLTSLLSLVASSWGKRTTFMAPSSFDDYTPHPLTKRNLFYSYKTPLPALEHDEYPWTAPHLTLAEFSPKIMRSQSMLELVGLPTRLLELKRTKLTMYFPKIRDELVKNVVEYNHQVVHRKCQAIAQLPITWTKRGNTLKLDDHQPFDNGNVSANGSGGGGHNNGDTKTALGLHTIGHIALPPHVSFCDEFRPEFDLQACPVLVKLEHAMATAMRNDINRGYRLLRTVVVLLRAREVKVVEWHCQELGWRKRSRSPDERDTVAKLTEIHAMYKRQEVDRDRLYALVEQLLI